MFESEGYQVVSGEDFRTAAAQVRLGLQTGDAFPVLVADGPDNHVSAAAWLRSVSANTGVVLIALQGASGLEAEGLKATHPAPAVLGEVLMDAGVLLPFDAAFTTTINPDGSIDTARPQATGPAPQPKAATTADDDDPWASSSVVPGMQVPEEPISPAPTPDRPVQAEDEEEDLWATSSTLPGMAQAASTGEPETEEFTSPLPQPEPEPQQQQEEEAFTAPAPAPQPDFGVDDDDDEEEFDFGDEQVTAPEPPPAPAAQPAPAPQPEVAAQPEPEPAPAAPAPPAPAAAPEQQDEQDLAPQQPAVFVPEPEPAPSPEPVVAPAHQPATHTTGLDDLDDILAQSAAQHAAPTDVSRNGVVIVSMSAKGGTGKSSCALNLAQYAALNGPEGMRVSVVDANRGQGDLRTYLRIPNAPIPTVYDAVRTGDASVTLSAPDVLAQYRDDQWGRLAFALLPAPPPDLANPEVVTAKVYADAIDYARSVSDLVVIDTQIHEAYDTSQLWDRVIIPLLSSGGWGLAITDTSPPGVRNLVERLGALEAAGVPKDRTLIALNKVGERDVEAAELLSQRLAGIGRYVGTVALDPRIETEMKVGRLPYDNEHLAPMLATALHVVTGLSQFNPEHLHTEEPRGIARLLRRRGRK